MNNEQLLNIAFEALENKLRWGTMDTWTEKSYRKLSEDITSMSGVSISTTTLKRLLGKVKMSEGYHPQDATLDALAIYLGYTNWDAFKFSFIQPEERTEFEKLSTEILTRNSAAKKRQHNNRLKTAIICLALSLFTSWALFVLLPGKDLPTALGLKDAPPSIFFAESTYSETFPFTTTFYHYPNLLPGKNIGGNYILTEGRLYGLNEKLINVQMHTYRYPGIYLAKAYCYNKPTALTSILVATNAWKYVDDKQKKKFVYSDAIKQNGQLIIPSKEILNFFDTASNITAKAKCIWYGKTTVLADNMIYETAFELDSLANSLERISIGIESQFSSIRLDLLSENVKSKPFIRFGDVRIDGQQSPYKEFVHPIKGKHIVRIINYKNQFEIQLDNKTIYTTKSEEEMGLVQGLSFAMTPGTVDYIKMKSGDQEYIEEFN